MRSAATGSSPQRGVTLVEAAIAVAVAGIVLSSAAPSFGALIEKQRIDGTAAELAADIHYVRSEAARRNLMLRLGLQTADGGTCWVIHSGAAGACACRPSGPARCTAGADAIKTVVVPAETRVALSANVASMLFDPLHGTSTPAGTLRITGASGRAVHHVVNVMGRVRTCSPQGAAPALPGYRVC